MAKRKSHKRKTHRRRRVGAPALNPSSPLVKFGSVAVGYLLGTTINGAIDKVTGMAAVAATDSKQKMIAAATAGIGTLLLTGKLTKGRPNLMLTVAGGVLAGAGLKRGLKSFNVITGYGAVDVISGYQKVDVISGYTPNMSLNGYRTAPVALNGTRPMHSKIMGGVEKGSGITNSGSDCMG